MKSYGKEKYRQIIGYVFSGMFMLLLTLCLGTKVSAWQDAIWPMKCVNITQSVYGSYSHQGTLNFDIIGNGDNNIYAPFDCKIVARYTGEANGNTVVIESLDPVVYANGGFDRMCMSFAHDNDISDCWVGRVITQGTPFYQTGTYGYVSGRHSHVNVFHGSYNASTFWTKNAYGNYCPQNAMSPEQALAVPAGTPILNAGGLNFKAPAPTPSKPTLSVRPGNAGSQTTFSWNATTNTNMYDVRIFNSQTNEQLFIQYGIKGTSFGYALSEGNYYATVASVYDGYHCAFSEKVYFKVEKANTVPVPGKPTVQVKPGDAGNLTTISWNATSNTSWYDVRVFKAGTTEKVFQEFKITGATSTSCKLNEGNYYATVIALYSDPVYTASDKISFSVKKKVVATHQHSYQLVTQKATLAADGRILWKCSCGMNKPGTSQTTIYRPKDVRLAASKYYYDGRVKTPKVTVVGSDNRIISPSNYTVSYQSGRKKVGAYQVTVTFKGNYSGRITKKFSIVLKKNHKHKYKNVLVKATPTRNGYTVKECACGAKKSKKVIYSAKTFKLYAVVTKTGKVKKPSVKVLNSKNKVISKKYYKVKYPKSPTKTGAYKVIVNFKGNYSGSLVKTFLIKKPK